MIAPAIASQRGPEPRGPHLSALRSPSRGSLACQEETLAAAPLQQGCHTCRAPRHGPPFVF
eukprot:6675375-Heterocapsa_arctica.AAC.1